MNIEFFCNKYNLGTVLNITQLHGGLMHKMYKVETNKGIYAIKLLNQVMIIYIFYVLFTLLYFLKKLVSDYFSF